MQPSTLVQLHGILHGTSYEHKANSVPPIGLIGNARSGPHPITVRSEDNLDDLHVSTSALCASFGKLEEGQVTKNEILCRCNGLRMWVPAEGSEGHVCQNTMPFEPQDWQVAMANANFGVGPAFDANQSSILGQGVSPSKHTGNYVTAARKGPVTRSSREGFGINGPRENFNGPSGRGRANQYSPSKRYQNRPPRF